MAVGMEEHRCSVCGKIYLSVFFGCSGWLDGTGRGVEENVCDSQKRLKVANFMSKPAGCAT